MPTRQQTDALVRAQSILTDRVTADMRRVVKSLGPNAAPEVVRDALIQALPPLVDTYGQMAAAVADSWYQEVYGLTAREIAEATAGEIVEKGVRRSAGHLWESRGVVGTLDSLAKSLDAWVKDPARQTLKLSAARDGMRFARIPSGRETCSFCLMLASRGAVYPSAAAAGEMDKFHGKCDCVIAPVRNERDYPSGYNPAELYEVWSTAAERAASSPRLSELMDIERARLTEVGYRPAQVEMRLNLWAVRAVFPDAVTDGHSH